MGLMDIFKKPKHEEQAPLLIMPVEEIKKDDMETKQSKDAIKSTEAAVNKPLSIPLQEDFNDITQEDVALYVPSSNEPLRFVRKNKHGPIRINEKRDVIFVVVENTAKVNAYRNDVLKLISKIIETNPSNLFSFLNLGAENKYFEIVSKDKIEEQFLESHLLPTNSYTSSNVKLVDAMLYIYDFVDAYLNSFKLIQYNETKYTVNSVRIIFIGTGKTDENSSDVNLASEMLKKLRSSKNINAIKYFCINDEDAINAAAIGFPVIGHIESNFYK